MLNANKERELAYLVYVDGIEPIPGKDRVEAAVVNGWRTMVKKGQFKPGDIGIYFEVDSKTPEKEPFTFLEKYHYKIKTQKFKTFYSQGLLMHPNDFGWIIDSAQFAGGVLYVIDKEGNQHFVDDESRFLTKQLEVTYAVAEDNKRKASSPDKYKKMAQRRPKLFKKRWARWMMKRNWGKKVMFFFFGKARDNRTWPSWVVKTDEERCQNMPWLFTDPDWHDATWIATEKIDGSSSTFTLKRGKRFHKDEYYVCSRNVCFDTPEKSERCYYDTNIYLEISEKYKIRNILESILYNNEKLDFVTIQGETYGDGIQKRTYSVPDGYHAFMAFNLIYGYKDGTRKRFNPIEMTDILLKIYGLPCVPILVENFHLPDTCDDLLAYADGESILDRYEREGIVFRDENGERSFKAVSNSFLVKYHQ